MITIEVKTSAREELVDVTAQVRKAIETAGISSGAVVCFVPHTTAAVTINENADPDVARDILYKLQKEFPQSDGYRHAEGNSDAHVKSSLVGSAQMVLVEDGRLVLGTWQAIYFCEFDGPRRRRMHIQVLGNA
jgi:secondary thiamine-phosphate synthase enzyme